jgi:hypothetical protein
MTIGTTRQASKRSHRRHRTRLAARTQRGGDGAGEPIESDYTMMKKVMNEIDRKLMTTG